MTRVLPTTYYSFNKEYAWMLAAPYEDRTKGISLVHSRSKTADLGNEELGDLCSLKGSPQRTLTTIPALTNDRHIACLLSQGASGHVVKSGHCIFQMDKAQVFTTRLPCGVSTSDTAITSSAEKTKVNARQVNYHVKV
jgi:hypothetical protein